MVENLLSTMVEMVAATNTVIVQETMPMIKLKRRRRISFREKSE